ncbi:MAG: hypothetical protein ACE5JI_14170 [Acidobacteriota bacterium]
MKTNFRVRDRQYHVEISLSGRPEGEKFDFYRVSVAGQKGGPVQGTLKLTENAIASATERASKDGGSAEDWVAHGCGRALASEVLIRELRPDFSFVVDHRWVEESPPES